MRYMKWVGLAAALILIASCFVPWVFIESKSITVTGIDATGTNFGKPGYFHLIMSFFFLIFLFIPRVWSKRANLLVVATNFAWAIRNYFMITACSGGDCPEKKIGIWMVLLGTAGMLLAGLFPEVKLDPKPNSNPRNN